MPVLQTSHDSTGAGSQQIRELRSMTAGLRDVVNVLNVDSQELHQSFQRYDLDDRAAIKAKRGVVALLDELYERGLGWNDIATSIGVSLSAVRKWRKNGECTAANRLGLARVAALLDLAEEAFVVDAAGWLLTPLVGDHTVRYIDLVAAERFDLVLDSAFQRKTATQAMDAFDADWRINRRRQFDVTLDSDGVRSLRRRKQ
ncbi:hypothetical protein [Microlunatus phosphovorus]|uniref:hypothetical protein n=1 Tax=Microlunatus phosphovorus TaxID=29405 RepID=UPI0005A1F95C|nr:hypothetical protein [Microlunatus phosphovorus]